MDRRTLLKTGGLGLLGLTIGGCARTPPPVGLLRPTRRLVPVLAAWERVIRTTVGLRPYRPSGFVLRGERLGDKLLVHNYGHGGAGMSLSWGTGRLAAELALERPERRAAVLGCGVVGLTTTRQLQRRGFDVTIYAADVPPNTTSNMSLAGWTPTSGLVERSLRTPAWDAQFRRAARIAYPELQLLVGRGYGVSWLDGYALRDTPPGSRDPDEEPLLPSDLQPPDHLLGPGEHPFPTRYARVRPGMRFEPSIYLEALMRDVLVFGGQIVVRAFDTPRDLMTLFEPVVVNCTGLGAKELFGDRELMPVKGQLVVMVPQPEVDFTARGMMPRSDGIVLGHVMQPGNASLEVDEEERTRVVENAVRFFSGMRVQPVRQAASRVSTMSGSPPVESFFDRVS